MYAVVLIMCWMNLNQCYQFFDPHSPHETIEACQEQMREMTRVITVNSMRRGLGIPSIRDARCELRPDATPDDTEGDVS